MLPIPDQLAQALNNAQSSQMIGLTILMAAGLIGLGIVAMLLRRWINRVSQNSASESEGGLGLSELRQMHAAGQLTDQEFAKAKEIVLKQMREGLPPPSPPSPPSSTSLPSLTHPSSAPASGESPTAEK